MAVTTKTTCQKCGKGWNALPAYLSWVKKAYKGMVMCFYCESGKTQKEWA